MIPSDFLLLSSSALTGRCVPCRVWAV